MPSFASTVRRIGQFTPSGPRPIRCPGSLAITLWCGLTFASGGCTSNASSAPPEPGAAGDAAAHAVYVSPDGWKGGDGTRERPFDLATAMGPDSQAKPGDTVWLRGGIYKGGFSSQLTGTADQPVVVRPVPGERVVIDSASVGDKQPPLAIFGSWTIYRDLEITSSDPNRSSNTGVVVHGPNTTLANMIVHDLKGGIAMWRDAVDAEAYGNIVYLNGWLDAAQNRAMGHGIYTQNQFGRMRLTDNVIFNQFGAGIHAYGSSDTYLDSMTFEGNIIFNNGILTGNHISNFLLGGGRVAQEPIITGNHSYSSTPGDNNIGYSAGCAGLLMRDNHFVMLGFAVQLVNCSGQVEHNTFYGDVRGIVGQTLVNRTGVQEQYPNNKYLDRPTKGLETFVRPNRFEPGRAHVVVYNWDKAETVSVDLKGSGLVPGTMFELRDVQNLGAPPVATGTYAGGAVSIPMAKLTETARVVGFEPRPKHTAPEFGVFLLTTLPTKPSTVAAWWASIRRVF